MSQEEEKQQVKREGWERSMKPKERFRKKLESEGGKKGGEKKEDQGGRKGAREMQGSLL